MAMYYQSSSEMQADGLHTLYLMNPNYAPYSDAQPNMLFFNPASSSAAAAAVIPHAPLHHFTGIPLSHDPSRSLPPPAALAQQQDIPAAAAQTPIPRLHYNTWGLVDQPQQTPRGLSLSLSAHHQAARAGFDKPSVSGDHGFPTGQSSVGMKSPESNGANSMNILGSKYLKAAQEVLEEVVSFDPGSGAPPRKEKGKAGRDNTGESGIKSELTTAERQEIQMKKSKLQSMLDEVEQRCRQYDEQMQIVVAAFEQAAGSGSAGAYTQLALKTILKQFRCLKSTISAQIKGLQQGDEDESSLDKGRSRGLSQLGLGMMQNNAWRPQRGLPERAVSLLRAWLFQHFLHPYPKDSDKQMLAKQTGLTRSQVSNWFINARVRLWKPMVEEMYLEETKNQHDASIKPELPDKPAAAASPAEISISTSTLTTASPSRTNFAQLISSLNMDSQLQAEKNPKKARNAAMNINEMTTENYLSMAAANVSRYGIDNQQAAPPGNSFSLSLALQPAHHDSSQQQQQQQQQFLSHRNLMEGGEGSSSINIGYEILDFQNSRKQFPAQLLPDFVT